MGGGAQGLAAEPMTEKADAVEKRQKETIGLAGTAAYTVDVQRCAVLTAVLSTGQCRSRAQKGYT